jgi:hypothetical protein
MKSLSKRKKKFTPARYFNLSKIYVIIMFAGWEGDSRLARMGKMNRNPQPAFF